jgi:hypothetical protein
MGRIARALGALVIVLALAGCGEGDGEEAATATEETAQTQAPDGVRELMSGELEPGRYTAAAFAVPFSFEVTEGWRAYEYEADAVTLGREREGVPEGTIPFRVVDEVYDPRASDVVPAPRNLARWLRGHPGLVVHDVRPAEFGGLPGRVVQLQAAPTARREPGCEGPCVMVAPPPAGGEAPALVLERPVAEVFTASLDDGRTLTVHVLAPASAFRPEAARVLQTVRFELLE